MQTETQSIPNTTGTESQLDRIERKLDALLDALAEEGDQEPETVEVVTMDGQRFSVASTDEML